MVMLSADLLYAAVAEYFGCLSFCAAESLLLAGVQPAFPQQWEGVCHPSHLGRVSQSPRAGFSPPWSHGLALRLAKLVRWLWCVLQRSNCGRQEKHSIIAPFPPGWAFEGCERSNNTLSLSVAVSKDAAPVLASMCQSEIRGRKNQEEFEQVLMKPMLWGSPAALGGSPGVAAYLRTPSLFFPLATQESFPFLFCLLPFDFICSHSKFHC